MAAALAACLIGMPATGELLRWTMAQKRSASSATPQSAAPSVNPRVTDPVTFSAFVSLYSPRRRVQAGDLEWLLTLIGR